MPLILLNGRELAARLGVTYQTVMEWARCDRIPSLKTGRGRVLFNLDQVADSLRTPRPGEVLTIAGRVD